MIHRRTVEVRMVHRTRSRSGAGERRVAEVESPGPDSIGQVSQSIEGYSTVGGQLAASHRDHAARADAQEVLSAGMERRLLSPGQDAQPRESIDDALAAEHLRT